MIMFILKLLGILALMFVSIFIGGALCMLGAYSIIKQDVGATEAAQFLTLVRNHKKTKI